MTVPATLTSLATGVAWKVQALTPAQGKAYKRRGQPVPRYVAIAPQGSLIRRATLEALEAAVSSSTAR